jgi:hypothetical protein
MEVGTVGMEVGAAVGVVDIGMAAMAVGGPPPPASAFWVGRSSGQLLPRTRTTDIHTHTIMDPRPIHTHTIRKPIIRIHSHTIMAIRTATVMMAAAIMGILANTKAGMKPGPTFRHRLSENSR